MANGAETGRAAQARQISEIQTAYILEKLDGAAVYPARARGQKDPPPVEFIYRGRHLLTRDRDLRAVLGILAPSPLEPARLPGRARVGEVTFPAPGLALIDLAGLPADPVEEAQLLFGAMQAVNQQLGPGTVTPDHVVHVAAGPPPPATDCPATEPDWVPADAAPSPGISRSRCDGRGTLVIVADTGLVPDAPASHPWMAGVTGDPDPEVTGGTAIVPYGGHGTFIASIIRAMAPRADVRVVRAFGPPGAIYESTIVGTLLPLLDLAPDVISLSAGTHTWLDGGLLSFKVFTEGPLRECERTVLVAAAGNDGADWKFSPADLDPVIGVGALGPPGDALAWFSDYGDWVKVFAPGQDLVHAFARGSYTYREARTGQVDFAGMARWSGTSFSTPVVSGLIAARMSGTGQGSREAADSLLRLARAQRLPGVGPVLHPGQACICDCGPPPCARDPRPCAGARPA